MLISVPFINPVPACTIGTGKTGIFRPGGIFTLLPLYVISDGSFSPTIVGVSPPLKELPPISDIKNILYDSGIKTILPAIVISKPPNLCGLAVLYHPLFNPAEKPSAIGLIFSLNLIQDFVTQLQIQL